MTLQPVRFSSLKYLSQSPAHYAYNLANERKETKALRFGSALDALLFNTQQVVTFDGSTRRGKAWDAFEMNNAGNIILTLPEVETIGNMLQALKANAAAMDLLTGEAQQRLEWTMNGRACRGTPDVFTRKRVVELKTTRSANPDFFGYDVRKLGYHAQLAWYSNALTAIGRCDAQPEAWIVAVESSPPYPITLFQLSPATLLQGEKLWRLWWERLLVCEASNVWAAYTLAPVTLDLPDSESLTLVIDGEETEV